MADKNSIELNLKEVQDSANAQYDYGATATVNPHIDGKSSIFDADYWASVAMETVPARIGRFSAYEIDKVTTSFQPEADNVDPDFNPFEVWKSNGHKEHELDSMMEMQNWDQYYKYQAVEDDRQENNQVIASSGLSGQAASFAANIVTDPTTYLGFGTAKMLESGVAKSVAYASGGAVAGASTEAIEQVITPERTAMESIGTIAAAATLGGLIGGGAVDSWNYLKGKSIVKGGDFYDFSQKMLAQADKVTYEPLGADVVRDSVNNSVGGSSWGKTFLTGLNKAKVGAKLRGQLYSQPESRNLIQSLIGTAVRTEDNFAGKATGISLQEVAKRVKDDATVQIKHVGNYVKSSNKKGVKFDDTSAKRAALLNFSGQDLDDAAIFGSYSEAEINVAKAYKNYFGKFKEELENIPEFKGREDFGIPMYYDRDRIAANLNGFASKVEKSIAAQVKQAKELLPKLQKQRAALSASSAKDIALERRLRDLEDEITHNQYLSELGPEDVSRESRVVANQYVAGETPRFNANKPVPKTFRARSTDLPDLIDFLHTDPAYVMGRYAQDVSPYIASHRTFGSVNPFDILEDYKSKMLERATDNAESAGKYDVNLDKEVKAVSDDFTQSWEMLTGEWFQKNAKSQGVQVASDVLSVINLGGQVLGSLAESAALMLHHGMFESGGRFVKVLSKIATDADFRRVATDMADTVGVGLEVAKNEFLHGIIDDTLNVAEINGGLAKKTSNFSKNFSRWNGSVYYDRFIRTAMAVSQDGVISKHVGKLVDGKIPDHLKTDLAYLGIDDKNAPKIAEMLQKYGTKEKGVFFSNTDKWTARRAAEVYQNALRRDLTRTAIQPDIGDTPFFFRTDAGKVLFKFKSWSVAATQKYLGMQLQRQDIGAFTGAAQFVGMSILTDMFVNTAQGKEVSTDGDELLWGGITRSGILGVIPEFGGSLVMNKLFDIKSGGARIYDFLEPSDVLAGVAGGFVNDVGNVLTPIGKDGQVQQSAINSFIDLTPLPLMKPYLKQAAALE